MKIDKERYEQLVDLETRVNVLHSFLLRDKHMSAKDIFLILGDKASASACEEEERLRDEEFRKSFLQKKEDTE
jgi:hypothetical protein|nr:MAG TPA: hypothetical protein [Caudoviricetes sp.]